MRPFSAASIWNTAPTGPLDPNSASIVANLALLAAHSSNINTTHYSVPVYRVPAGQPTVKVTLSKAGAERNPLQMAWLDVPLPPDAMPALGSDKHLVVVQGERAWEFWDFEWVNDQPTAAYGGAIQNLASNPGAYDVGAWPQPIQNTKAWEYDVRQWGATGCSLSVLGGLITFEDCEQGRIDHALAMAVPNTRAGAWCPPAQRTDGKSTASTSIPMGARFRLDPTLSLKALGLPHFTLMLAEAAQTYGIVIRDSSSAVPLFAEDPKRLPADPYIGPTGYFGGIGPTGLLRAFPWKHLQLLKMTIA